MQETCTLTWAYYQWGAPHHPQLFEYLAWQLMQPSGSSSNHEREHACVLSLGTPSELSHLVTCFSGVLHPSLLDEFNARARELMVDQGA